MKKTTKGALAAGAAAVLLAGGAGTYAAWTASTTNVTGGQVQTGHLTVTQESGAGWTWTTPGKENTEFVPSSMSLAPGDSVKFTGDFKLGIKGTNLTATATVGNATTGALPAGLTWTPDANAALTNLDEGDNGTVVQAGGTLTFVGTATDSMDKTINIGDLAVTLKQTAPAVAS